MRKLLKLHRVLVTGSRDWALPDVVMRTLDEELINASEKWCRLVVMHGDCRLGADRQADYWAKNTSRVIVERYPARWRPNGVYNPQAGLLRNRIMVERRPDVCLAFIRSGSRGASHCASLAEQAGIPVRRFLAD